MDIDLSCFVYDKAFNILETIWYGNLRNANESIRHHGDALVGAKSFDDSLIQQEQIQIKLDKLLKEAHHLVFVLSSYHNQPLKKAKKKACYTLVIKKRLRHLVSALTKSNQTANHWRLGNYLVIVEIGS